MRILYLGDVVGRSGRDVVAGRLPRLRRELKLDFVICCGENAAHGFGITPRICDDFFNVGVDVLTTGNHAWDQREIIPHFAKESRLLRPINFPPGAPGAGLGVFSDARGRQVLVVQVMGRLFMDALDCPFRTLDQVIRPYRLGGNVAAIVVDFHAEATSEKQALAMAYDGRVSAVVCGHTHVPSADARVLPKGTAFQTDAGMCGDYTSVIGMKAPAAIDRFVRKGPGERLSPADGPGCLCGLLIETDDATGKARRVAPLRMGAGLAETGLPHWH
ncbi:TIGR00282 family metallophosphoesterase [Roseospirillum parvum]|uniref:Metallophosphoesterase n=1 Tax=Roseospirillum parvum TaxID=83401 RepID=A0A1G8EU49_9PROT|nr:TIGR00282 family metallophosphoesterase [Roseospirillum parvum]SDH73384.1 hypothetical protein SAMN05421742_11138 [Roseospirillum parvum]